MRIPLGDFQLDLKWLLKSSVSLSKEYCLKNPRFLIDFVYFETNATAPYQIRRLDELVMVNQWRFSLSLYI